MLFSVLLVILDLDFDEMNYADMEPEYDMEFANYGPNPIELPMSPPRTPPLDADRQRSRRDVSPFSEASSMTSVTSTESVGMHIKYIQYKWYLLNLHKDTIERNQGGCFLHW